MNRQMAKRPLIDWGDGNFYREDFDLSGRERIRIGLGTLFLAVVFIAVLLLSGGPS